MQQKKDSIGITFFKNILPKFFVNFSCKRVLWPLGHIFNKVNGGIVQRFDEVGTKNCPGRWVLLRISVLKYLDFLIYILGTL